MSELKCIQYCDSFGYAYAGVEYGAECYCANTLRTSGVPAPEADCNMQCAGNEYELCGGPNRLNVFHNAAAVVSAAGPATNAGPQGWGFQGCCESKYK